MQLFQSAGNRVCVTVAMAVVRARKLFDTEATASRKSTETSYVHTHTHTHGARKRSPPYGLRARTSADVGHVTGNDVTLERAELAIIVRSATCFRKRVGRRRGC